MRLSLLSLLDAEELFALVEKNRARLREWLPWLDYTQSVEDSRGFIKRSLEEHAAGKSLMMGIFVEDSLVGLVGFNTITSANRSAVIGYWIDQDHSGQGLMTGAVKELIDRGFKRLNLHRIEINAATDNLKSCAIPLRLGFNLEGTKREAEWLYDHFVSLNCYSLLRDEWCAETSVLDSL